ncbi:MAG: hypothetical protein ACE5JI_09795 [Acidobacteriota bacterium]
MSALFSSAILLGYAVLLALPFRDSFRPERHASRKKETQEALETRKQQLVITLRDLDYDFRMGKLDDKDFRELDARYRAEAMDVLRALERTTGHGKESEAERLIAAHRRRKAESPPPTCTSCGGLLKLHYRFCPGCGQKVQAEPVSQGAHG